MTPRITKRTTEQHYKLLWLATVNLLGEDAASAYWDEYFYQNPKFKEAFLKAIGF